MFMGDSEDEPQLCDEGNGMCDKPVEKGRSKCSAHRKRRQRLEKRSYQKKHPDKKLGRPRLGNVTVGSMNLGPDLSGPVAPYNKDPLEAIAAKGLELADVETDAASDDKFHYIKEQLRNALRRAIAKREAKKSRTTPNPRSTP